MAHDLFDELARMEVPPPPADFDRELHARVNKSLLVKDLFDLLLNAAPWAMLHFGRALLSLIALTLSGKQDIDRRGRAGGKGNGATDNPGPDKS